jgi:uncharacterized protein YjbI with pentapeptide repeats
VDFSNSFIGLTDFSNSVFYNWVDFSGAKLGSPDFSNVIFFGAAPFEGVTFIGDTNFSRASFAKSENSSFSKSDFLSKVNFSESTFPGITDFFGVTFSEGPNFRGAEFSGETNFNEVNFPYCTLFNDVFFGKINFSKATFPNGASFGGVTFSGHTNFISTVFSGMIIFSNSFFSGDIYFSEQNTQDKENRLKATFSDYVFFNGVNLSGWTFFSDIIFPMGVDFSKAIFSGITDFSRTIFKDSSDFSKAIFYSSTNFTNAEFSNITNFSEAIFDIFHDTNMTFSEIIFSGTIFSGETYFSGVTFSSNADILHNAKIMNDFDLSRTNYRHSSIINPQLIGKKAKLLINNSIFEHDLHLDLSTSSDISHLEMISTKVSGNLIIEPMRIGGIINLNNLEVSGEIYGINNISFENYISEENFFRNIKNHYENLGNNHEADEFYFKEMIARRKQKPWYFRIIELPLQKFFFYGTRPGLTFIYWLLFVALFTILYLVLDMTQHPVFNATDLSDFVYFSLTNAITPGYGGMIINPGLGKYLASFEAIVGTFFIASFITIFARKYMRS